MKYSYAISFLLMGIIALWSCAKPHSQLYTVMEDLHYKATLRDQFIEKCAYDDKTFYNKFYPNNTGFFNFSTQFTNMTGIYTEYKKRIGSCASSMLKGEPCNEQDRHFLKKDASDCRNAEQEIMENKILRNRTDILQASLSHKFDTRGRELLEKDDRINIIVEKVHIGTNEDIFMYGEVAVVVSVIDGSENDNTASEEGTPYAKDVIVYFSKNVPKSFDLPFSSLLAYSGEYGNRPIIVKIMVIDIDEYLFDRYNKILDMAAKMGDTLSPAYAAATSLAASIGKLVLETASENDVIAEFQFPLYPKSGGEGLHRKYYVESPGLIIASTGRYIILSTHNEQNDGNQHYENTSNLKERIYQQESYYLDSNSNLYQIPFDTMTSLFGEPYKLPKDKAMFISEKEGEIERYRIDKDISYAIISVDNRKLEGASQIVNGLNKMYRELKDKQVIPDSELTKDILEKIELKLDLFKMISEYEKESSNKLSFLQLVKKYKGLGTEKEKDYLLNYIHRKIDFDNKDIQKSIFDNISGITTYFKTNYDKLKFDDKKGKFTLVE